MNRLAILLLLIFLIFGLPLSAGRTVYAQEGDVIKLGALLPLSGFGRLWGIPWMRGMEIQVEEMNASGGIKVGNKTYKVELEVQDTAGKDDIAVSKINKMIFMDKIKFVMGPVFMGEVLACQSIAEPNKVIMMPMTFSPKILGADRPYSSFRLYASGMEIMAGLWPLMKKQYPNVKTIVMSGLSGERETAATGAEMAKGYGYEVSHIEYIKEGTTDYYPIVTKIMAKNPDAYVPVSLPPGEAAVMLQTKQELGFKGAILTPSAYSPKDLSQKANVKALEGFVQKGWDPANPEVPEKVRALYQKFGQKYPGESYHPSVENGYRYPQPLKQAIETAGALDTTAVMKALENLEGENLYGKFTMGGVKTYGIKRQLVEPVMFSKYKDGKLVYIGSATPAVP
jgi:branched-chain amino acid transport system substrate-binding protein